MPNPPSEPPAAGPPLAGFRGWGPGIAGANGWRHRTAAVETLPPPCVRDDRQTLISTVRGAVLVMLTADATVQEVLAALEAAHTKVQREQLAKRRIA